MAVRINRGLILVVGLLGLLAGFFFWKKPGKR